VRIPIANIGTPNVRAQAYLSADPRFNSFRVAQNCGTTAFFAAHGDTSTLRVFSWDETQNAPTSQDGGIARWAGGQGYQSFTPDGRRWLDRIDPRLTEPPWQKMNCGSLGPWTAAPADCRIPSCESPTLTPIT
jgi:hypothetical protein